MSSEQARNNKLTEEYFNETKQYVYAEKHKFWRETISKNLGNHLGNKIIFYSVQCIKALGQGDPFKIVKEMMQTDEGEQYVIKTITQYYKDGPNFYRFYKKNISEVQEQFLEKLEADNKKYASNKKALNQEQ